MISTWLLKITKELNCFLNMPLCDICAAVCNGKTLNESINNVLKMQTNMHWKKKRIFCCFHLFVIKNFQYHIRFQPIFYSRKKASLFLSLLMLLVYKIPNFCNIAIKKVVRCTSHSLRKPIILQYWFFCILYQIKQIKSGLQVMKNLKNVKEVLTPWLRTPKNYI